MNHYKEVEGLPISLISERTAFKPSNGVAVNPNLKVEDKKTGTTTVGVIGTDFVLLAADQQATMGHTIADDDARKIYKITDYIALTISGTVGDSLAIIRFLKAQANLYEIERNTKMTPKALTSMLSNVLNGNRYYPYMFMPVIGGINSAPELFEVTPFGCISEKKKYAVTGSGTDFALTTLDSEYKDGMNEDEALNLAVKAVMSAKNRDIYTGGKTITVIIIDKAGYRELEVKEIEKAISRVKLNVSKK
jgi:proteasome beta subunit